MASHQPGSSQHRRHSSRSTDGDSEDVIEQIKQVITSLDDVVSSRPHQWETYLASARSAVTALERLRFFRDPARFAEQVWIIQGLQDYAYHDADTGCIEDIAEFCQASWLRVLRNFPDNVEVLTGMRNSYASEFSIPQRIDLLFRTRAKLVTASAVYAREDTS